MAGETKSTQQVQTPGEKVTGFSSPVPPQNSPTDDKRFNVEIPTVSLPKGGGAIKSIDEKFEINAVNGSANFSIPLPSGSARGFAASLGIAYNSGGGNGIFGMGWSGDEFDDAMVEMSPNDFPSSELEYHILEWSNQSSNPAFDINNYKPRPNFIKTKIRETHYHAHPLHQSRFQESYTYFGGGGQEVLKKIHAEPGEVLQVNPDGTVTKINTSPNLRWVGNGRVILNNKGNPVKQYEPYFSVAPAFDDEKEVIELGVTPIIKYDPLGRVIHTDFPNKTFSKVEFTAWLQKTFDPNDTVSQSDWYKFRIINPDPALATPEEINAAQKAFLHNNTPTVAHLDTLGRIFFTESDCVTEKITTHVKLDIEGNELEITDALNRKVMQYNYDMISRSIKQISMDAGTRWMIMDATNNPLLSWDERDHEFSFAYDKLRRPVSTSVKTGNAAPMVFGKIEYGESIATATAKASNLRGVAHRNYDQSGILISIKNDFKGNLLSGSKQLVSDYKNTIDWTTTAAVVLGAEIFSSSRELDALNRPVKIITPHSPAMPASEIYPGYNEAGMLDKVDVKIRGAAAITPFITNINYDAKGQREEIFYNNGAKTKYTYDKHTFRLINLLTTRTPGPTFLQDLKYTYDPVGNITRIKDAAQPDVFFDNENAQAINNYEYDAIYRLISATGRKHAGQTDMQPQASLANNNSFRNHPFINSSIINPNDANAFRNYTETYIYDKAGNMKEQKQVAKNSNWTRTFEYDNNNNLNNRLTKTSVGADNFIYTYDAHGNMYGLETVKNEVWNFMDHFKQADLVGGGKVYYVYDGGGQRIRKVIERQDGTKKERIYLGGIEIYRERNNAGNITLERETLQVLDDQKRIAMVDTPVVKPAGNNETQLIRYQYDNHLGSASLELDNTAKIISYEEFFPYGTSSYSTVDATREVAAKRYRYTGKERDEESGLNYHRARYYAVWLCRWTAADPDGIIDGNNVFRYVHSNPVKMLDPTGKDSVVTVNESTHTITYSTTVHIYASKSDAKRVQAAAKDAQKFFSDQNKTANATYTDPKGQAWKVEFAVNYSVHTNHPMPVRLDTTTTPLHGGLQNVRVDTVTITNQADYKSDKIKAGDNFFQFQNTVSSRSGLQGTVEPEYQIVDGQQKEVGRSTGTIWGKETKLAATPTGATPVDVELGTPALRDAIVHETGHMLGFDERYNQTTLVFHPNFENDIMSNAGSYSLREINRVHFEDAARLALEVTNNKSGTYEFGGGLDSTVSGTINTQSPNYQATQDALRKSEVSYYQKKLNSSTGSVINNPNIRKSFVFGQDYDCVGH